MANLTTNHRPNFRIVLHTRHQNFLKLGGEYHLLIKFQSIIFSKIINKNDQFLNFEMNFPAK